MRAVVLDQPIDLGLVELFEVLVVDADLEEVVVEGFHLGDVLAVVPHHFALYALEVGAVHLDVFGRVVVLDLEVHAHE